MITIKDIARICNVSVSTVSYALSDNSTISEKTKARIRATAKELNYIPNSNARGLKQKATHKIGVFVPGFQGSIHPTIIAGIAHVLRNIDEKYNIIVTFTDDDMTLVKSHSVDLAIMMDGKTPPAKIFDLAAYVPIITFDQNIEGDNISSTSINNMEAMTHLTELMMERGCKRIGFLMGSNASYHSKIRLEGYKKALAKHNIPFDETLFYNADAFTVYKGNEVIEAAIHDQKRLPFDGLVCCNDELAIGAIEALQRNGFSVPGDCLVSGFDNIEKASYLSPSLTTAHVDWFEYGLKIADLALKIVRNQVFERTFSIEPTIIERESTKR
jgi:LacI family transcriptional regulator